MTATSVAKTAQIVGGLVGVASAIGFAWDSKPVGVTCAAVALALVVPAARFLNRK